MIGLAFLLIGGVGVLYAVNELMIHHYDAKSEKQWAERRR